jgi:hypothetical protein
MPLKNGAKMKGFLIGKKILKIFQMPNGRIYKWCAWCKGSIQVCGTCGELSSSLSARPSLSIKILTF